MYRFGKALKQFHIAVGLCNWKRALAPAAVSDVDRPCVVRRAEVSSSGDHADRVEDDRGTLADHFETLPWGQISAPQRLLPHCRSSVWRASLQFANSPIASHSQNQGRHAVCQRLSILLSMKLRACVRNVASTYRTEPYSQRIMRRMSPTLRCGGNGRGPVRRRATVRIRQNNSISALERLTLCQTGDGHRELSKRLVRILGGMGNAGDSRTERASVVIEKKQRLSTLISDAASLTGSGWACRNGIQAVGSGLAEIINKRPPHLKTSLRSTRL